MTPASKAGNPIRIAQTSKSRLLAGLRQTKMGINADQGFPSYPPQIALYAWQAVCLDGTRPNGPGGCRAQEPSDSVPEAPRRN